MSREKGAAAEREVAGIFRDAGIPARRTAQMQAGTHTRQGDADVTIAIPGGYLEVRRRERISIEAWCLDAESCASTTDMPVVVWRRNRQPWRVSMLLDDYIDLLKEARGA